MVTHFFACERKGYVGWRWAVTVTRAYRLRTITIDEVVLLPGDDAIVAPEWVPYRERIKPGDLSPGDLLPVADDDPRLVPTYFAGDDPLDPDDKAQLREVAKDLGLGRVRTLSIEGRELAAQRWYDGDAGPGRTDLAVGARAVHDLRLPGPDRRTALGDVRGLRQRRRQRRRQGGGLRPRVRRALGGAADQASGSPADAGARVRHRQPRRDRRPLARSASRPRPAPRCGRPAGAGSTRSRTARGPSRPGTSTATRCGRRPRARRRTAAARGTPGRTRPCRPGPSARRRRRVARRRQRCRSGCRTRASSAGCRAAPRLARYPRPEPQHFPQRAVSAILPK